jgi:hypothetical protein
LYAWVIKISLMRLIWWKLRTQIIEGTTFDSCVVSFAYFSKNNSLSNLNCTANSLSFAWYLKFICILMSIFRQSCPVRQYNFRTQFFALIFGCPEGCD